MKVKNIMFFGFAAAILSAAGAVASPISNATDRQIVTSKAYVDSKVTAINSDISSKADRDLGNLTSTTVIDGRVNSQAAGAEFTSSVTGLTQASTIQGAIEAAAGIANGALVAADIVEGDTAGAIEVDGTAVPVHGLATVATSGAYSDLTGTPTVGDSNLTITDKDNNTIVFGANATSPVSGTLKTVPAKPNTCTDTNPCALITLDSGEYDWVQMAQPSNN